MSTNLKETTGKAYTYKRYMRDGSVKECHAVTRSRAKKKSGS